LDYSVKDLIIICDNFFNFAFCGIKDAM